MTKCPKCSTDNPEGSGFCRGCGQSLQTELVCSRCQYVNIADSRFCNKCGQPLTAEKASPPTPPPLLSPPQRLRQRAGIEGVDPLPIPTQVGIQSRWGLWMAGSP